MLEKISKGILKYKGIVILVFSILLAITIVGTVFLVISDDKINSDMVSYLDDDSTTKLGLTFLQNEFDIRGNATLVVRVDENNPDDVNAFRTAIENVSKLKNVTNVTWYGAIDSYEQLDVDLNEILSSLNANREYLDKVLQNVEDSGIYSGTEDLKTLLTLADYFGVDFIHTDSMESYLRHSTSTVGVYDYVVLVLTDIDAGDGAYNLLDQIKEEFSYTTFASTGTTETAKRLLDETVSDLPWFILVAVLSVFIILLLSSSSFIEPFILVLTLAVGVIMSMGINYVFPSISIISFAVSAVLQLAITMDYAIFYMHIYRKNRTTMSLDDATIKSIPEVTGSVAASGLTTIGGFAALYCMKFSIGTDIANVLIKGVVLSMLTVLILQPILTYLLDDKITKTKHSFIEKLNEKINKKRASANKKEINVNKDAFFRPVAKFSVWQRIVLIVIAVGLMVPSFIAQSKVEYSYLELYEKDTDTEEAILANEIGNQLIVAVPLNVTKNGATQQDFIRDVLKTNDKRITGMMGAFTAVDIKESLMQTLIEVMLQSNNASLKSLKDYLDDPAYLEILLGENYQQEDADKLEELLDVFINFGDNVDFGTLKSYFKKVDETWYTLYTISFNGNTEDREAQDTYQKIMAVCEDYFGKNSYYPVGMITSSYEMGSITPSDFLTVTLVSIAIIYVIVTVLLRNPLKSLFAVLLIELGIWINFAITFLIGDAINFVVYIIISSVQLGCTVDYAILFANTFEQNRDKYPTGKECAVNTAIETLPSILTGALMIGSVCLGMYFISSNLIIKQLTGMLARGALISLIIVAIFQPAVWSFFKTERKTNNYQQKLEALENQTNAGDESENVAPSKKTKKKKLTAQEKLALLEQKDAE